MVTLGQIAQELFDAVLPSRVTIRGAAPGHPDSTHLHVEILAPGVPSMRGGGDKDAIVAAPTYVWMRENRRILVQADCREDPLPPAMLTGTFGVGAQMLGPFLRHGELVGGISVHHEGGPRTWTTPDIVALGQAVDAVAPLWQLDPRIDSQF